MPFRPATIDEFPEIQSPNQAQTGKGAPSSPRPPLRQPALTSRSFIRNDLRARTGARVAPAVVDAVQALVHGFYAAVVHEVVACYWAEADLRRVRGDEHRLTLQPRHAIPPSNWPADWNERSQSGGDGEA